MAVMPDEKDQRSLRAILGHSNWDLAMTSTVAETVRFLERNFTPVILCERDLPDGSWMAWRWAA